MAPVSSSAPAPAGSSRRGLVLVATAIVLTGFNLRTAVNAVGPVLEEIEDGLGISSSAAGVITTMPVLCFAVIGFAGPPLVAKFRDGHVLAAALLVMTVGLVGRALASSFGVFLAATAATLVGGALGNVLLPVLVKTWFPHRTGLMVGAYGTALAVGGASASFAAAPIAEAVGAGGWRWSLGIWAVFALIAALPWLAVPARAPMGSSPAAPPRVRRLLTSRLAWAMAVFFGLQSMQAYIVFGWVAQYLRDAGLPAATAGVLVGVNALMAIPLSAVVPLGAVRSHLQRPMLVAFVLALIGGWVGLQQAPLTLTLLWVVLLGAGMGSFPLALTLIGLRGRHPGSVAALSTFTQGVGYALACVGPLLVGVLRGATGSYSGMFVLVYAGAAGLLGTGWLVTRGGFIDDEVTGLGTDQEPLADPEVASAGVEPAVTVHPPAGPGRDACPSGRG